MSKCDIIIPVWNQVEDTKGCIDSIRNNTLFPYRLIVIDNASDDETAQYLSDLEKSQPERVTLLTNKENQGFIKAVNKGINLSTAEYVCILNNDTVVTSGWLKEMIKVIEKDPKIGIVNPSSNTLGQRLLKGMTLDEHAKNIKSQTGLSVNLGSAFGFCMLTRRKLFDKIGLFDEIYGMGNFEDTDFSLRAKKKDYKTVRAFASYVHHKESGSFNILKGFKGEFEKNRRIFESKWGGTRRIMVVSKEVDKSFLEYLRSVLKEHAKEKSWVYVISPIFETKEFFKNYSNLTFYHFRHFFYVLVFFKLLFKKKKPDIVYCDNKAFSGLLKIFCKAAVKIMDEAI